MHVLRLPIYKLFIKSRDLLGVKLRLLLSVGLRQHISRHVQRLQYGVFVLLFRQQLVIQLVDLALDCTRGNGRVYWRVYVLATS